MAHHFDPKKYKVKTKESMKITADPDTIDLRLHHVESVKYLPKGGPKPDLWTFAHYHATSKTEATVDVTPTTEAHAGDPHRGPTGELTVNLANAQGDPVPITAPVEYGI